MATYTKYVSLQSRMSVIAILSYALSIFLNRTNPFVPPDEWGSIRVHMIPSALQRYHKVIIRNSMQMDDKSFSVSANVFLQMEYDVIASLMLVSAGCALGSGIESEEQKSMNPIPMNETIFLGL